jgi:hypothetical protein
MEWYYLLVAPGRKNKRLVSWRSNVRTLYDEIVTRFRQVSLNLDKGKAGESQRRKATGAKTIGMVRSACYASQLPKEQGDLLRSST